jgi:CubicO group peptidase (beta-lactamase class C family)
MHALVRRFRGRARTALCTGILLVAACTRSAPRADSTSLGENARIIAPDSATLAALASDIEARRAQLRIPGAAVAIVMADTVLIAQGFGLRNVASALPATANTLFALGSCTKPFTSLALAIASDSGVLSLDDSPRRFLPWFALRDSTANAQVSFRDLLSHRTGVKMDDAQGWYERNPTRPRLIRFAMSGRPTRPFRTTFQYNNFMYVAAGEALASAFQISFAEVLQRLVLAPVGMTSSTTSVARVASAAEFALGYRGALRDTAREPVTPRQLAWLDGIEAAGGVWSNAHDMSRWLRVLVGGGLLDGRRIVSDSALAQLLAPAVRTSGTASYGLGWFIEESHGHPLYSHAGGVSGFGALCEFAPSLGLGWAVLTNVDDGTFPRAVRELVYQHLAH